MSILVTRITVPGLTVPHSAERVVNPSTVTIWPSARFVGPSSGLVVSDANLRQLRVLHIVSAGGVTSNLQASLFMPLLTRLPRPRVKAQVACLSPGAVPSAVLRQNGVPTFDLALSRKRFSPRAFQELLQAAQQFRPDVIQAWGHTAQIISSLLRGRCDWKPRLVWSVTDTAPLAKNPGLIDRQKLKYAAKFAARADRICYTSEAAASQHQRAGFPETEHSIIPPGVDATRFKPDFTARSRLREQLNLPGEAFVVGMAAAFQPESDHATLIKALGELIKVNPNIALVLAGHGVQKGNAPLMALVGGGAMATRVHLLGEWSDISALYNACDVVCSSSLNDQSRMNLVMAMLCGVPCVATGMGAQGEVIGQHGMAIEPGSPTAFVKAITRVMQLTPDKRTHLAQGARKHALTHYVYVKSLQKYLQLYYDLIGRQSLVTEDLPTPEIDATLTPPPALPAEAQIAHQRRKPPGVVDLSDPDSLESKVAERQPEELPKWRIEQEQERNKREAEVAAKVAEAESNADVLQVFESQQSKSAEAVTPMTERARGVVDDAEELLPPELLATEAPVARRAAAGPVPVKKSAAPAPAPSQQDAAKLAALKAARMAALQPIASGTRPAAKTRPITQSSERAASPSSERSARKIDIGVTQPLEAIPEGPVLATVSGTASAPVVKPVAMNVSSPPVPPEMTTKHTPTSVATAAPPVATPSAASAAATDSFPAAVSVALESVDFGGLSLMSTGAWSAMQRSEARSPEAKTPAELDDAATLSLITDSAPPAETSGLSLVAEPVAAAKPDAEAKLAASGQ